MAIKQNETSNTTSRKENIPKYIPNNLRAIKNPSRNSASLIRDNRKLFNVI